MSYIQVTVLNKKVSIDGFDELIEWLHAERPDKIDLSIEEKSQPPYNHIKIRGLMGSLKEIEDELLILQRKFE